MREAKSLDEIERTRWTGEGLRSYFYPKNRQQQQQQQQQQYVPINSTINEEAGNPQRIGKPLTTFSAINAPANQLTFVSLFAVSIVTLVLVVTALILVGVLAAKQNQLDKQLKSNTGGPKATTTRPPSSSGSVGLDDLNPILPQTTTTPPPTTTATPPPITFNTGTRLPLGKVAPYAVRTALLSGAEPGLEFDNTGRLYVNSITGLSTGTSHVWYSTDATSIYNPVTRTFTGSTSKVTWNEVFPTPDANTSGVYMPKGGSGDADIVSGIAKGRAYFLSLAARNVYVAVTRDGGATWIPNVFTSTDANYQTTVLPDRPWFIVVNDSYVIIQMTEVYNGASVATNLTNTPDPNGIETGFSLRRVKLYVNTDGLQTGLFTLLGSPLPDEVTNNFQDNSAKPIIDRKRNILYFQYSQIPGYPSPTDTESLWIARSDDSALTWTYHRILSNQQVIDPNDTTTTPGSLSIKFPTLYLENTTGQIYIVTVNDTGHMYISVSNDTGFTWLSHPVIVKFTDVAVFPAIVAGPCGSVGIAWYGVNYTDPSAMVTLSNGTTALLSNNTYVYYAFTNNIRSTKPVWEVRKVDPVPCTNSAPCTNGLGCNIDPNGVLGGAGSRALGDFLSIKTYNNIPYISYVRVVPERGAAGVLAPLTGVGETFVTYQTGGRTLLNQNCLSGAASPPPSPPCPIIINTEYDDDDDENERRCYYECAPPLPPPNLPPGYNAYAQLKFTKPQNALPGIPPEYQIAYNVSGNRNNSAEPGIAFGQDGNALVYAPTAGAYNSVWISKDIYNRTNTVNPSWTLILPPPDYLGSKNVTVKSTETDGGFISAGDNDISYAPNLPGTIYYVALYDAAALVNVLTSVSRDGGATWTATPIALPTAGVDRPWIIAGLGNSVYIVVLSVPLSASPNTTAVSSALQVFINTQSLQPGSLYTKTTSDPVPSEQVPSVIQHGKGCYDIKRAILYVFYIVGGASPSLNDYSKVYVSSTRDNGYTWSNTLALKDDTQGYYPPGAQTLVLSTIGSSLNNIMPSMDIDQDSGMIAVSAINSLGRIFLAVSTDFGQTFKKQIILNFTRSSTFPSVVMGKNAKLGVFWAGSSTVNMTVPGLWYIYYAYTPNINQLPTPQWTVIQASDTAIINGTICNTGVTCPQGSRDLLDFITAAKDKYGRAYVAYTGEYKQFPNGGFNPNIYVATQNAGPLLY